MSSGGGKRHRRGRESPPSTFGLKGTEFERAQAGTIRTKLLKVGAMVHVSVRRVVLSMSAASPVRGLYAGIVALLAQNAPAPA